MTFNIKILDEGYTDRMAELESLCAVPAPWSNQLYLNEFRNPASLSYGAFNEDESLCGFIIVHVVMDEADISNIVVNINYQNQGIGQLLLEYMVNDLRQKGVKSITLEVREHNLKARHIYEKCGFKQVTTRSGYYANGDLAILMKLFL